MKVIDAYWEKRNLGKSTVEITFSDNEPINEDCFISAVGDYEYVVCKVPVGDVNVNHTLNKFGFCFIESSFELGCDVEKINLNPLLKRLDRDVDYVQIITEEDLNILKNNFEKGIVKTDRIALDTNFGVQYSSKRFYNWILDEIDKESTVWHLKFKGQNIGFFGLKKIGQNGVFYPFLGGIYDEFSKSGLGFSILTKATDLIKKCNGNKIITYVSSNNLPILKLHLDLGFSINNIHNVFTRHYNI